MVKISAQVFGGKELDDAFRQLPRATAKGVLRRALAKAAEPVVREAEALAPRGPTGNLKASITVSTQLTRSQRDMRRDGVELFIGATTPKGYHAHLLEFGTVNMPAQPFLRPAWDAAKDAVLASLSREVWAALAKSARTLARKAERGTLSRAAKAALNQ